MQQVSLTGHRVQPAAPHCFNLVVDGVPVHHGRCVFVGPTVAVAPGLGHALMVNVAMASSPPQVTVVLPVHGEVQRVLGGMV